MGCVRKRDKSWNAQVRVSGLEDCSRRPKRVLGVGSNRFLPICLHILSHVSSGLSLFIAVPYDSNSFARCVYKLFELMYVHTSVPFRGIYMDDNVLHSKRYIIYAKVFNKLQIARGKSIL